ncbi:MAG TPA: hypothetical protein VK447_04505, partial [Myxococcaceae bacterium]|nr:hypothetical protein [Myxococcaceae bacterium]
LQGLGYDVGRLDGVFDDKMLKASQRFEQTRGGLGTTGTIGEGQTRRCGRRSRTSRPSTGCTRR